MLLLKCYTQYASKFGKLSSDQKTGKGQFSFESQRGEMLKIVRLPQDCTHSTCQQSIAQNSPSQTSTVYELRTSRCSSWIQKSPKNQRSNCQHPLYHRKSKSVQKTSTSTSLTILKPFWGSQQTVNNFSRDGNARPHLPPEKHVCRSRNNSQNQTWRNRQIPNWEWSTSGLYIVTLLI